jgi:hypothetical protein
MYKYTSNSRRRARGSQDRPGPGVGHGGRDRPGRERTGGQERLPSRIESEQDGSYPGGRRGSKQDPRRADQRGRAGSGGSKKTCDRARDKAGRGELREAGREPARERQQRRPDAAVGGRDGRRRRLRGEELTYGSDTMLRFMH